MALNLRDCTFFGPALPEPFVLAQLETELARRSPLPKNTGEEGRALQEAWDAFRRKLRALGEQGGDWRVFNHVLEPLAVHFGYTSWEAHDTVVTREGAEDGGYLLKTPDGKRLRAWATALGTDLDAPNRRGRAYRFSPSRVAQRVLLASGERVGLLTDGEELRLLICDPARPDSHISVSLSRSGGWREARNAPDSYRLFRALASPVGVAAIPDLTDAARLAQSQVTKKLRVQARKAIEGFIQEVMNNPSNREALASAGPTDQLAKVMWREGLILVYRLLFVFKLESSADPARAFSFAATSLWRNTYSPNTAMAPIVRKVIDQGADSGGFLESGLRALWRMFSAGMSSSELEIKALGGMLFGEGATPLLDRLSWGEPAVAQLLDALLWTPGDGRIERERVHYGALDVEDLGRVYEALLELEPGITTEPMCRLRRAKLEVVVPRTQGNAYRANVPQEETEADVTEDEEEDQGDEETPTPRGATRVVFIEDIPANRFFLRVGLGRKSTGSYYTPHPFVRFLVQETLGPQLLERSPKEDPQPERILGLKVIDPAMGSGHFLVEACRYLGEALYEACRLCDELAVQAEDQAANESGDERDKFLTYALQLRKRVQDLPDPDDELMAYLPSRVAEGEASGLSQKKAEALCRRLVAVHCLYGVDKNPLAVELAKLSLWLESYAEGWPLTFMDHRLICGDSLTGPFFEHLLTFPKGGEKLDGLFAQGLTTQLRETLTAAMVHVHDLEASVGKDVADLEHKHFAKEQLDLTLTPLKLLAAAWSGGAMLGDGCDDEGYQALAQAVGMAEDLNHVISLRPRLREMVDVGQEGVPFDLAFPEVFFSTERRRGFDAVLGNPPWDRLRPFEKEFFAGFDIGILDARNARARSSVVSALLASEEIKNGFETYKAEFQRLAAVHGTLYPHAHVEIEGINAGRGNADAYILFGLRALQLTCAHGLVGLVLPSAFHANEGATGLRQQYLKHAVLHCCFSFENRKKLFEIDSRFKFAVVVLGAKDSSDVTPQRPFLVRFYLQDAGWLFAQEGALSYDQSLVAATGGSHLSFVELKTPADLAIAQVCHATGITFGKACSSQSLRFSVQADVTRDSWRFVEWNDRDETTLPLDEGKTLHQFTDRWLWPPRFGVPLQRMREKRDWLDRVRFFRVAFRGIASSTNERTSIFCMLPPGSIVANSAPVDAAPAERTNASALIIVGVMNSFISDWCLRIRASANVNQFILNGVPLPKFSPLIACFLAHSSLRLTCNHGGYASLWAEQLNNIWREAGPMHSWPVLESGEERWAVRAAIDAVVVDAYGLDREQYVHALSSFSHRSYTQAPELCLATFDELKKLGLEAFTKKHDPYWDIPLNENLPEPAIDLPVLGEELDSQARLGPLFDGIQEVVTEGRPSARRPIQNAINPDVFDLLVRLIQERGEITSGDAQTATGLDATGVRPLLRQLVDEGHAVVEGQRRGTRYRRA